MSASAIAHFERRAGRYLEDSSRGLWGLLRAAEWRALRERLDLAPDLEILDAGCGAGHYSARLRAAGVARIRGVDASPAMIARYRALGFEGSVGTIEGFRCARRFDRILAAGVLEFVARPQEALESLAAVLRPGGRIVCLVPAGGPAGLAYAAVHRLWGCPARALPPRAYLELGRRCGLAASDFARVTPLSCAFALAPDARR